MAEFHVWSLRLTSSPLPAQGRLPGPIMLPAGRAGGSLCRSKGRGPFRPRPPVSSSSRSGGGESPRDSCPGSALPFAVSGSAATVPTAAPRAAARPSSMIPTEPEMGRLPNYQRCMAKVPKSKKVKKSSWRDVAKFNDTP
ncbi:hypothetical protein L209DRAFT_473263 [Thermothelomyces heterothallicus CBS 203.75]